MRILSGSGVLALLVVLGSSCRFAGICLDGKCDQQEAVSGGPSGGGNCSQADLLGSWNSSTGTSDSLTFQSDCTFSGTNYNGCNFSGRYTSNAPAQSTSHTSTLNIDSIPTCGNFVAGTFTFSYQINYGVFPPTQLNPPGNMTLSAFSSSAGSLIITPATLNYSAPSSPSAAQMRANPAALAAQAKKAAVQAAANPALAKPPGNADEKAAYDEAKKALDQAQKAVEKAQKALQAHPRAPKSGDAAPQPVESQEDDITGATPPLLGN